MTAIVNLARQRYWIGSPVGYGAFSNALFVTVVPSPSAAPMLAIAGLAGRRRRS